MKIMKTATYNKIINENKAYKNMYDKQQKNLDKEIASSMLEKLSSGLINPLFFSKINISSTEEFEFLYDLIINNLVEKVND